VEDLKRCCRSKAWRLSNLYWIKDKHGKKVKFKPNKHQRKFQAERHGRDLILKARQLGFSTFVQIDMLDDCLFNPNTNAGVIADTTDNVKTIFKDKIKFAYDALNTIIKSKIAAKNDAANELRFDNGSVIIVGTSLRSGTYLYVHISEHGKICANYPKKAKEIRTGTIPTIPLNGKLVNESTAMGRLGDFYEDCENSRKRRESGMEPTKIQYKFHFYPWFTDDENRLDQYVFISDEMNEYFDRIEKETHTKLDVEQRAWYVGTKEILKDDMKQEHPSTPREAFDASIEGAYFSRQMAQIRAKNQIGRMPIATGIPIETFWDLGKDTTSIWFFQKVGFEWNFIDYYENDGEWMQFYVDILKDKKDGLEKYMYGDCYLPHDGTRASMGSPNSPADILHKAGFNVRIVPRTPDKAISIERARYAIPRCNFHVDRCSPGIIHLDNYRKAKDEKNETWLKLPVHDKASHGADAFMTFADGYYHEEEVENQDERDYGMSGKNVTTGY